MKRSLKELEGFAVQATDGNIGHVREFYFDDGMWVVRYMVVATGTWLSGRKVLIAPQALQTPDWNQRLFPVSLTREQVRSSPDIDTDKPVARQHEVELNRHYGWEVYWAAEAMIGDASIPVTLREETEDKNKNGKPFDPHLRTTRIVAGLHVQATDGRIGHIADLIADDQTWKILHLVLDTKNWLPGRKLMIAPDRVTSIQVENRLLKVNATLEQLEALPSAETY